MKKKYLKPDAEYIKIDIYDSVMDVVVDGSFSVGEDDEEGI